MDNGAVKTEPYAITLYWIELYGTVLYGPPTENKKQGSIKVGFISEARRAMMKEKKPNESYS